MNVLIFAPNFYPGNSGFANAFTHFALELANHKKVGKVVVFTLEELKGAEERKFKNVRVVRGRSLALPYLGRLISFFLWVRAIELLVKEEQIDVVLYETGTLAPFGLLVLRMMRKKYPSVKFIMRVHAIGDTERVVFSRSIRERLYAHLTKRFYLACNAITATNTYHIDFLKKNFLSGNPFVIGRKTFFVVPNIVHISKEATLQNQHSELFERMRGKKVFFSLGGFSRGGVQGHGKFIQKGHMDLLYGVSFIQDKSLLDDVLFLVVGRGMWQQYFKEEIRRLGLSEYFMVLDRLPNELVHYVQQRAHGTILLSRLEGLSMFALEALANGSPLLVTKTGGLLDIVEEGRNGYVVEAQDIEDISRKIVLMASFGEEEITKMRSSSREMFRTKFSPELIVEKFVRFVEILK